MIAVEEISGTRFKTDTERDAEIESAMSLCWRAADEITRLTARVAELEGGIKKALDATLGIKRRSWRISRRSCETHWSPNPNSFPYTHWRTYNAQATHGGD